MIPKLKFDDTPKHNPFSLESMIIIIEAKLAHEILKDLPLSVISVILSDDWAGGALISLKDQMSRPSAEEIATNAMWLLPMVKDSPRKARF